MASLKELASQQNGTAAEIASVLNTPSVERKRTQRIGWRTVATISQGLSAAVSMGLKGAVAAMNGVTDHEQLAMQELLSMSLDSYRYDDGLDFSDPSLQSQIDVLIGMKVWDAETGAAIKALGVWLISPCEANNLPAATGESVQTALDSIATDAVKAEVDGAINGVQALYQLTPGTTREQAIMRFVLTLLPEKAEAIAKALGE